LSLKNERQRIEWRRNKVLELSSQGHSQPEISRILQVSLGTVNKDIQYLRQQAHETKIFFMAFKLYLYLACIIVRKYEVYQSNWEKGART
jgi:biotin operon repressor